MLRAQRQNSPILLAQSGAAIAHTGTTDETTLVTVAIPGGAMGLNEVIRTTSLWSYTNSANTKTLRTKLDGTIFDGYVASTTAMSQRMSMIRNRNSQSSQIAAIANLASVFSAGGGTLTTGTMDTSVTKNLTITAQLALGTETVTLESYIVELLPF